MKRFLVLLIATPCLFTGLAQSQETKEGPIDFNKARSLIQKQRTGEELDEAEERYLKRAKALRRKLQQQRRRGGRGSFTRNYKTPSVRADELLASVGELTKDGDAYMGELTEEGAKALVGFGGGRGRGGDRGDAPERPQPPGVKATAKFWVKDGVLAKHESVVAGKIKFGDNERDLGRTTTVEIKEVGSTKIDVPEDIKAKLSAEDKPAAEAKKPAEETKAEEQ